MTSLQALAGASDLDEIHSVELVDNTPTVFTPSNLQRSSCRGRGVVCVAPGGSDTMLGTEITASGNVLTVLARGRQIAAQKSLATPALDQPWQVQLVAKFRELSRESPIIVALFDTADPDSIARREAKLVWTVSQGPSRELGMSFQLTTEDGFEPSHTYLVRVAQTTGNADIVLADGIVHLE
jgi:hypothetical protein